MAASQQQNEHTEFDRLWSAIDKTNAYIQELETRFEKRLPRIQEPSQQHAPSIDYRVIDAQWPEANDTDHGRAEPCGCEEAEALKTELDQQRLRAGNAENKAADLQEGLVEAELRIRELESALAEAQARASTAPASQADILCVEQRLEQFEIKLGLHHAKLNELDQRTVGSLQG